MDLGVDEMAGEIRVEFGAGISGKEACRYSPEGEGCQAETKQRAERGPNQGGNKVVRGNR